MAPDGSAIDVFYAYSHRDEDLRDELEKHLSSLRRERLIVNWHDRRIGAGNEFKGQIDERLNSSDIILLLVSVDFLNSDYCYDIEMQRALERNEAGEARVIPIILRACDWTHAPFSNLLALPEDGIPVTSCSNRDEAFAGVAHGIRKVIEELVEAAPILRTPQSEEEVYGSRSQNLILLPAQLVPNQSAILIGRSYTNGGSAEINNGTDTSSVLIDGDSTGLKASGVASATSKINEGSKITIDHGGNWSASIVIPMDNTTVTPGVHELKVTDDHGSEGIAVLTILERTLALSPPEGEPGTKVDVFGSGYPAENAKTGAASTPSVSIKYTYGTTTDTVATLTPDTFGNISGTFKVPRNIPIPSVNSVAAEFKFTPTGGSEITVAKAVTHQVLTPPHVQ